MVWNLWLMSICVPKKDWGYIGEKSMETTKGYIGAMVWGLGFRVY